MKILYAIQGTGNGHISRARDIIPLLQQKGELDILVSGTEAEVSLPYPIKYQLKGLSFVFGKKGGIDLLKTYRKSSIRKLYNEIRSLPVQEYDIIINDFEPVSAWAALLKSVPCLGLSHQAAVISKHAPRPRKTDIVGKAVLHNYAPVIKQYGFHFEKYGKNIFTPVIRSQVRFANAATSDHYTVYLPAYADEKIIEAILAAGGQDLVWHIFSKHSSSGYVQGNFHIFPVNNDMFVESMITSIGVLCGAGFETPAEAIYLGKKLLVVPMKGQYEQQCNAAALKQLGVTVIKSLNEKHHEKIGHWITDGKIVAIKYPDQTKEIVDLLFEEYEFIKDKLPVALPPMEEKKFRKKNLEGILDKIQS